MDTELPHALVHDGARIRYGTSGSGVHDLVLVHGNGAHHLWWEPIARKLEDNWRLITLDLSGHGDSGHRASYSADCWVGEIRAVLDAVGSERPVVVGHSMGGRAGVAFAAAHPERTRGLVIFDASIRPSSRHRTFPRGDTSSRRKVYPSEEVALGRFRLMPEQPQPGAEIMDPLARYSLLRIQEGWTWKHDPNSLMRFHDADVEANARKVSAPMVYAYAENSSVVDDALAQYAGSSTAGPSKVIKVPGTHHHLILEKPDLCRQIIEDAATAYHSPIPDLATVLA